MDELIPFYASIKALTEDLALRKNISNGYSRAAKKHGYYYSHWNGKINDSVNYVKAEEFYDWVKARYEQLIPEMPIEHQKVWKKCYGYLDSYHNVGVYREPSQPKSLEEAISIIKDLMSEIRRLENLVSSKETIINQLKPLADRYRENCATNTKNASKPRSD